MMPLTFWNPLAPASDPMAYRSFKVDETVYADPWCPGHIPDYSRLPPIAPKQSAWDHSGQTVVWVRAPLEVALLAELQARDAKSRPAKTITITVRRAKKRQRR